MGLTVHSHGTDSPTYTKEDTKGNTKVNKEKKRATSTRKKSKTSLPTDFEISPRMRKWAAEKGWENSLEEHTEAFKDYHLSKDSKFVDWVRAWYTWIRNANTRFANGQTRQNGNGKSGNDQVIEETFRQLETGDW
jgi:hypothetical protein